MAKSNSFCLTALAVGLSYLSLAASLPTTNTTTKAPESELNKVATWVVEEKRQDEVFPQDEGYVEIQGPEPSAARKKRDVHDEHVLLDSGAETFVTKVRRDLGRPSAEGPQYVVDSGLSRRLHDKRDLVSQLKGDDSDSDEGSGDSSEEDDDDEVGENKESSKENKDDKKESGKINKEDVSDKKKSSKAGTVKDNITKDISDTVKNIKAEVKKKVTKRSLLDIFGTLAKEGSCESSKEEKDKNTVFHLL